MTPAGPGDRVRPGDAVSLGLVAVAIAVGVLAYDHVPARMLVHYTPPGGVYYGPETLPKELGLSVVPAVGLVTWGSLRGFADACDLQDELAAVEPIYDVLVVLTIALETAIQVALVAVNVS